LGETGRGRPNDDSAKIGLHRGGARAVHKPCGVTGTVGVVDAWGRQVNKKSVGTKGESVQPSTNRERLE